MDGMALSKRGRANFSAKGALLSLIATAPGAMGACLPLKGSKACSAFQSSSVSTTDDHVVGLLYVIRGASAFTKTGVAVKLTFFNPVLSLSLRRASTCSTACCRLTCKPTTSGKRECLDEPYDPLLGKILTCY
jgi:hypothetical protein